MAILNAKRRFSLPIIFDKFTEAAKGSPDTMDVDQALEAVNAMRLKIVIPCHYNVLAFFTEKYNPADDAQFRREVAKSGSKCVVLDVGESINLGGEQSQRVKKPL